MSDPTPTRAAAGPVPVPKEVEDLLRLVHEALRDRAAWDRAEAAAPDEPDVQARAAGMAAWLRRRLAVDGQRERTGGASR